MNLRLIYEMQYVKYEMRNSCVHVSDYFVCTKPNIVHLVAVKNQDILNDDALHFKLA